ncbi:MAG: polysaccharide biosynthesis tyrosine autokinase [Desulfobacteraceae bacterium]|nr:polysaccharide biosynthesis tyrosine autokinase [Desulfobacteraceae bacterium]
MEFNKEIHIRDYIQVILKRKNSAITFFTITVVVTIIAALTSSSIPMFTATTDVMIEKNNTVSLTGYRYAGYNYDPFFTTTQSHIISSAKVAKKVVDSLGSEKIYDSFFPKTEFEKSFLAGIKTWFSNLYTSAKKIIGIEQLSSIDLETNQNITGFASSEYVPPTKTEQIESAIRGGIIVMPVEQTKIVQISFSSTNPAIAMQVANSVAQAYIDVLLDMRMQTSNYSINWMKKKAESQREELEESEKDLHNYKKKYNIVTIEDRLTILPERLSSLSSKLTQAEAFRKELFAVYSQTLTNDYDILETIPSIADNASFNILNKETLLVEQNISDLSKKYGKKHPKMISARNKLKSLKIKKQQELKKASLIIKNKYLLAQSNEKKLSDMFNQAKFEAEQLSEKSIQLDILKRKVTTNKYLYDALIKSLKEKGLTEKNQLVNVWVLRKAELPMMPINTQKKKRNILLGIILGLFGGIGVAFFLEYLDNTARTPEDLEEKFDIPVIGTIELHKNKEETIVENFMKKPDSSIAEGFKSLRTSIFLSSADTPPKTLMITSVEKQDGKSSVSLCLAATMAQTDKNILLIDADMRRPTQHIASGLLNSFGLSSYLAGVTPKIKINKDCLKNLDIVTSGPIPPNPSELLHSAKFARMLDVIKTKYDVVIIDSPPITGVTDPIIISNQTEGVILVTSAGKTTYDKISKVIKQLEDVTAPMTGIILNKFNAKDSGYLYSNYGDYYYSSDE